MNRTRDMTGVARERRQAVWQQGHDQAERLDKAGHFAPPDDLDAYERYLYLIGICNYLSAQARDLGHIDQRPAAPVVALEGAR